MKKSCTIINTAALLLFLGVSFSVAGAYTPDLTTKADGYSVPYLTHDYVMNTSYGVRSFGMGEAQTARPDDLSAMYYNPAGLSMMGYWEYGLSYKELPNDTHGTTGAVSIPLSYGTLGILGVYHYVRDNYHVRYGENTHPDANKQAGYVGISYGAPIYKDQLHGGINIKYAASDLRPVDKTADATNRGYEPFAQAIYFDLGFIYTYDLSLLAGFFFYFPNVATGISARNLHFETGLPDEGAYGDEEFNLGVSFYYDYRFMGNVDIVSQKNRETVVKYGVEFWPIRFLAIRGGFQTLFYHVDDYRGFYWGVGIGESVGSSKFALEYSGSRVEYPAGNSNPEFYHRFAFVQSFEKIYRYKTKSGKEKVIPIAQADRYNTPLQFARFIDPEDLIDDIIDDTSDDDGKAQPLPPDEGTSPNEEKPKPGPDDKKPAPPVIRPKTIALYPFQVEFSASEPRPITLPEEIRQSMLGATTQDKYLKTMRDGRYKLTPKREQNESYVKYLNRLCLFHRLDAITFVSMVMDDQKNEVYLNILVYRKGDKSITSQYVKKSSMDEAEMTRFKADVSENYYRVIEGMLELREQEKQDAELQKKFAKSQGSNANKKVETETERKK